MKCEILCLKCSEKAPKESKYPQEHVKLVFGKSIVSCVCDWCGSNVEPDDHVAALSIWADYGGIPYRPWEHDYIEQEGVKK